MKMCMFLYFHVNFIHESTQTCMFPCKFAFFYPPIHHSGKGSNMDYHLESDHSDWQPAICTCMWMAAGLSKVTRVAFTDCCTW